MAGRHRRAIQWTIVQPVAFTDIAPFMPRNSVADPGGVAIITADDSMTLLAGVRVTWPMPALVFRW